VRKGSAFPDKSKNQKNKGFAATPKAIGFPHSRAAKPQALDLPDA
jgi:hypothetical protein